MYALCVLVSNDSEISISYFGMNNFSFQFGRALIHKVPNIPKNSQIGNLVSFSEN